MEKLSQQEATEKYAKGFCTKCASYGVDPESIIQGHTLQTIVPEVLTAEVLEPIVKAAMAHGFMEKNAQAQAAPTLTRDQKIAKLKQSPTWKPDRHSPNEVPQTDPWSAHEIGSDFGDTVKTVGKAMWSPFKWTGQAAVNLGAGMIGYPGSASDDAPDPEKIPGVDAPMPNGAKRPNRPNNAAETPATGQPAPATETAPATKTAPANNVQQAAPRREGKIFGVNETAWNQMSRPMQQEYEADRMKAKGRDYVYGMNGTTPDTAASRATAAKRDVEAKVKPAPAAAPVQKQVSEGATAAKRDAGARVKPAAGAASMPNLEGPALTSFKNQAATARAIHQPIAPGSAGNQVATSSPGPSEAADMAGNRIYDENNAPTSNMHNRPNDWRSGDRNDNPLDDNGEGMGGPAFNKLTYSQAEASPWVPNGPIMDSDVSTPNTYNSDLDLGSIPSQRPLIPKMPEPTPGINAGMPPRVKTFMSIGDPKAQLGAPLPAIPKPNDFEPGDRDMSGNKNAPGLYPVEGGRAPEPNPDPESSAGTTPEAAPAAPSNRKPFKSQYPPIKSSEAQGFYDRCIECGLDPARVQHVMMKKYGQAIAAPTTPEAPVAPKAPKAQPSVPAEATSIAKGNGGMPPTLSDDRRAWEQAGSKASIEAGNKQREAMLPPTTGSTQDRINWEQAGAKASVDAGAARRKAENAHYGAPTPMESFNMEESTKRDAAMGRYRERQNAENTRNDAQQQYNTRMTQMDNGGAQHVQKDYSGGSSTPTSYDKGNPQSKGIYSRPPGQAQGSSWAAPGGARARSITSPIESMSLEQYNGPKEPENATADQKSQIQQTTANNQQDFRQRQLNQYDTKVTNQNAHATEQFNAATRGINLNDQGPRQIVKAPPAFPKANTSVASNVHPGGQSFTGGNAAGAFGGGRTRIPGSFRGGSGGGGHRPRHA